MVAFMEMTKAILEPGVTPTEFASVYPGSITWRTKTSGR